MCQYSWYIRMYLHNLTFFTLQADGLCLPNLFIYELPLGHYKASISCHFFADTVAVKAPHQKQICSIFVSRLGLVHHLTFFIWRTVGLFFPKECFHVFAMLAIPNPVFGIVISFGRHLAYYH